MDNDAARHDLIEALALVQEQMEDLAALEAARAELTSAATVADGTVTVTVDADGVVVMTEVSESYFEHRVFADLGAYITDAAQEAARDVALKMAELLAPMAERRERVPSLSDVVEGAPDIRDLLASVVPVPHGDADPDDYPTVRSAR